MDRKPGRCISGAGARVQETIEEGGREVHGYRVRLHEEPERGSFESILSRRAESSERRCLRTDRGAVGQSRTNEVCKTIVSFFNVTFSFSSPPLEHTQTLISKGGGV